MVGCKFSIKENKLIMKNFVATMTPMRISFIGGGSDIKDFYQTNNNGGAVISAAINKYVYIILNKYHDKHRCLLKYCCPIVHSSFAQQVPSDLGESENRHSTD